MNNKIICIHSDDEDLKFLDPFVVSLENKLDSKNFNFLKLSDVKSHYDAHKLIEHATSSDLIILLCHGGTDYVLGQQEITLLENGIYYHKFIASHNISILSSKKVICVSCESGIKLGQIAVENNCSSFIGFGDIQFEDKYHLEHGEDISDTVKEESQKYMCELLTESMLLVINKGESIENFINYFRLLANKKCDAIILENKGSQEKIRVANFLWNLKNEIILFGNSTSKIIE